MQVNKKYVRSLMGIGKGSPAYLNQKSAVIHLAFIRIGIVSMVGML